MDWDPISFFICSISLLYIAKSSARNGCFSRQADRQKAKQWFSTWTSKYTSRTA